MARGTNKKAAAAAQSNKAVLPKQKFDNAGNTNNPFQLECKRVLQKLCEDNQTTIINVAERFEELKNNMDRIQEGHKKRTGWRPENDLIPNLSLSDRHEKAQAYLEDLADKHDLDNLRNVKVVKEFDGLGLRKSHKNVEDLHVKEKNLIRIPIKAMLSCESSCNSIEFEKFIKNDRMTSAMMNVRLALRLIYHKYDSKSEFKSWLETLPSSYQTPMYWSVRDFASLQKGFEACNEDALTAYKFFTTIARQYLYFLSMFSSIPSLKKFYNVFTWDSYKWAVSTVQTRANQLTKTSLGFIPILELCNTNLKSELVIGRIFVDEEKKSGDISMAELDITPIGNNKNIYFSYSGNVNNRSSLQSLIHNGLCFPEKVEVTVHLPQSKPLHQEKIDYMKYVGGDDFNVEACLSPLVKIRNNDKIEDKTYALKQMIHFLIVALDREPTEEEMKSILVEREKMDAFTKSIKDAREAHFKHLQAVEDAKMKDDTPPEKPEDLPKIPTMEDRPPREFIYDYTREELKPKAKQFLKIRLTVLKRYLDKVDFEEFDTEILKNYVITKHQMYISLIDMVDSV